MAQQNEQNKHSEPAPTHDSPASEKPRRIHWRSGLGILLGGAVAEAAVLTHYADDATLKIYISIYVLAIAGGLFILWWLFRSGFSWRIRLAGVLIVLLGVASFSLRYRIDGFTGAMWPIISLRSQPSPEQRVARYFDRALPADPTSHGEPAEKGADGAAAAPLEITGDDWPRFRGPQGDGVVRSVTIRTDWIENPPQAVWKHPVGPAWSSFAVVGERLFTQEQRDKLEAVVCYDAATGREIWQHTDKDVRYSTLMGGTGPRATPTIHDSRVYSMGATGILNCLDARTGTLHWQTDILEDAGEPGKRAKNLDWGMAGSPLVFDDVVVVNPGGDYGKSVIAYDRLTGEQKWAAGKERAGYAAPRLETIGGERQLLIYDGAGVAGCDPRDGRELWRFAWTNSDRINVAQPIVRDESLVFISSGYGTGSALLEITSDIVVQPSRLQSAGGTPAPQAASTWSVTERWRKPGQFKLKFNDTVYKDGYLYGLDEGILSCIEFETGERMWKRGRYGHGQLLLVEEAGLLLIQAEEGDVVLVPATPDGHRELARFPALDGKTWNHPVLNRGRLYVRNFQQAACYDLRDKARRPRPAGSEL